MFYHSINHLTKSGLSRFYYHTITIINNNGEEINVNCEVPTTEEERAQGLMYRDNLDEDSGMFFDSVDNGFWMKNVKIPLDMIFINNNEIAEIIPARPFDQTNISPSVR